MDYNSIKNQDIKQKFVSNHVYCNVNSMTEYILSKSFEDREAPFSYDDVTNFYILPEYRGEYASFDGGTEEQRREEISRLEALKSDLEDDDSGLHEDSIQEKISLIEKEIAELEDLESEPQEVFTWYMVSSYLAEKLAEKGECVLLDEGIWGRGTFGQAILLDYVISSICSDMEILEGQANSW